MALRSSWTGFLKLSLVSVPIRAFSAAAAGSGRIHLHQLHETCHSRIRYEKVCPLHGEVTKDEIVSGYEYAKGQYVVVQPNELDELRTASEKAINIDKFVPLSAVDPMYFDGRAYYLLPDGAAGNKPYALLSHAMEEAGLCAVAPVVVTGREQLAVLRSEHGLLSLLILHFASQIKPTDFFVDDLPELNATSEERRLAKTLIGEIASDSIDLSQYRDVYTEKLTELIEAKVEGKEVVAQPKEEEAPVINLMDALRKSVAQAKGKAAPRAGKRKRMPATRRPLVVASRKRKTS